jgi:hypothetical protein
MVKIFEEHVPYRFNEPDLPEQPQQSLIQHPVSTVVKRDEKGEERSQPLSSIIPISNEKLAGERRVAQNSA